MSKELTSIEVPQSLTVKELAVLLDVDPIELVKQFMRRGLMYSLNQYIDFEMFSEFQRLLHLSGAIIGSLFIYFGVSFILGIRASDFR